MVLVYDWGRELMFTTIYETGALEEYRRRQKYGSVDETMKRPIWSGYSRYLISKGC
jgi:hypothetical protein